MAEARNNCLPFDDDPFAAARTSVTKVLGCRMVVGMVTITYHRNKQALSVSGKYCDVSYSRSHIAARLVPVQCDEDTVRCVHPTIFNKALTAVQELDATGCRSDSEGDGAGI